MFSGHGCELCQGFVRVTRHRCCHDRANHIVWLCGVLPLQHPLIALAVGWGERGREGLSLFHGKMFLDAAPTKLFVTLRARASSRHGVKLLKASSANFTLKLSHKPPIEVFPQFPQIMLVLVKGVWCSMIHRRVQSRTSRY